MLMSRTPKRTYAPKTVVEPPVRPVTPPIVRPRHKPSQEFQDAIVGEINAMIAETEAAHIHPTHVIDKDLTQLLHDALNALYHAGRIQVGHTINNKWIKTTENATAPQ